MRLKKHVLTLLVVVLVLSAYALGAYADNPIRIFINDKEVYSDVNPQLVNGRVLVPLRLVAESMGAEVLWNTANNSVYISTKESSVPVTLPSVPATSGIDLVTYRNNLIDTWNLIAENQKYCTDRFNFGSNHLSAGDIYNIDIRDKKITESLKLISNPPEKYIQLYDALMKYYMLYKEGLLFAKSPPGDFDEYNNTVNDLNMRTNTAYKQLFITLEMVDGTSN